MEKRKNQISRLTRWLYLLAILSPNTAFASPLTPALLYGFVLVLAWLTATVICLCNARKWGWKIVLPVCLSFPLVYGSLALYHVCDGVLEDEALQKFEDLCQAHARQATQIFSVAQGPQPKHFLIDETANYRSFMSWQLTDCIKRKETPSCAATDVEFLEVSEAWYETKSGRSRVCDEGTCKPEIDYYLRGTKPPYDGVDLAHIEKPVSEYVIRFGPETSSGQTLSPFKRVTKTTITLEAINTGKVYARTEILALHLSQHLGENCPDPASNEVAKMIQGVFPSQ